eukprot:2809787-Rhodomonas_salina.2
MSLSDRNEECRREERLGREGARGRRGKGVQRKAGGEETETVLVVEEDAHEVALDERHDEDREQRRPHRNVDHLVTAGHMSVPAFARGKCTGQWGECYPHDLGQVRAEPKDGHKVLVNPPQRICYRSTPEEMLRWRLHDDLSKAYVHTKISASGSDAGMNRC